MTSLKKLLPMFLLAVSFCLISCGNKTTNQTDLENNTPEVSIETNVDQDTNENNAQESTNVEENNDATTADETPAAVETASPVEAE